MAAIGSWLNSTKKSLLARQIGAKPFVLGAALRVFTRQRKRGSEGVHDISAIIVAN